MAKFIQLFRNELNAAFLTKAAAKSALENNNINPDVLKDGMPILARYLTNGDGSEIKTLLGIAHVTNGTVKVTVFDSGSIDELDSNITASTNTHFTKIDIVDGKVVQSSSTVSNIDLATILDYVENTSTVKSATNLATTDTIAEALAKVEQRVDIEEAARVAAIEGLDYTGVTNATSKVVTDVTETDGIVSANTTAVENLTITTLPSTADTVVANGDSLGTAVAKLQGQIVSMDLTTVTETGKPIIAVAQTDGKVTASAGTITATAVTIADSGNVFTATEVEGALEELYNKAQANEISSPSSSITISTASTGTSIDVNADGTTIVIDGTNGKVKSNLTIKKYTKTEDETLAANIKEQYRLTYGSDNIAIGQPINIYKDSSLYSVYLGHMGDTITSETDPTVITGAGDTALCFIYYTANGTYELVKVDVQVFLEESEFSDGLQVTNHVVSVKVDSASESVVTGASASGAVLSVSSDGVKISNIQNAIDYKVSTLDATVSGESTDKHVAVKVEEVDGKLTAVTVTTDDIASASALTAEIAARKAVDGINGDAYTANTGVTYIGSATDLNNADVVLDSTIATLSGKTVTAVEMTGGTAAIAAANDGTKKITINTDGSQIKLDNYTSASSQADIATTGTVNDAIGQLEYRIAQGTSGLQTEVDAIETAVGLGTDGTHVQSTGHYTSGASTIEGEIIALDTQLSAVSNTYLSDAVTGNNGVTVAVSAANETGKTATVSLKLDSGTTSTTTTAQYASNSGNALQITDGASGGLYLDSTWDCGFYTYQAPQNNG